MSVSTRAEFGVLGGGVIGASVAWSLARVGKSVVLLEGSDSLGRGATGAAIGGITPASDDFCRSSLKLLSTWSAVRFTDWLRGLARAASIEIPLLESGLLYVALTDHEWERLSNSFSKELTRLEIDCALLSPSEAVAIERELTPAIKGALHIPIESALEPKVLIAALTRVLTLQRAASIINNCCVTNICERAECVEVASSHGTYEFETAIACLGLGTREVLGDVSPLLRGVRGQATEFRVPGQTSYALTHHIYGHLPPPADTSMFSSYIVPRSDGRVVVGVTYEDGEEQIGNTTYGIDGILSALMHLIPNSRNWDFLRAWSGIRPATKDGRPIVSFYSQQRRLLVATGHFGLGITLAPVTCQIVLELLGYADRVITTDPMYSQVTLSHGRLAYLQGETNESPH